MASVRMYSAKVYADLAYLAKVKTGAARRLAVKDPKPVGRCTFEGEPLKASHKVIPVSGSIQEGHPRKGTCPLCGTPAKVSDKGFMTAHIVRNEPMGSNPAMSSVSVEPTDTGSRVGDPDAGDRRRSAEIDGAFERGTVSVKVKGDKGRAKAEERPATEENVRLALADAYKAKNTAKAARLLRQARASMAGTEALEAPTAGAAVGQRGHGMTDGAALAGANMRPVQPRSGWLATAGTMSLPVGRVRPDLGSLGAQMSTHDPKSVKLCADQECRHIVGGATYGELEWRTFKGLSRSQQKKYWGKIRKAKDRAHRARENARQVEVRQGSPFGTKHLVDDSMGRTEMLMQEKRAVAKN